MFLQHHALDVAQEVQRSYVGAARVYYETGFRRYTRSLGVLKAGGSSWIRLSLTFKDRLV